MAMVFRQVEAVAPTGYSVVISGESGTGKEMLAKVVHRLSNRSEAPFLPVNMAAFSGSLFEDEFFGHTKGAYTNAVDERKGFLEEAQGGSLFLDEITELDLPLQGKLLRVIEERELYRLGSTRLRNVDVRFIAATNRDIPAEIEAGHFRPDLLQPTSVAIPLKGTDVEESAAAPLLPLAEMEREHIHNVLKATRGDRAKAAEILGINLSTVYRKIKRYGLR